MAAQRVTIRHLEKATSFSYEHLRKVVGGMPVASQACNKAICRVLGLDEGELWATAVSEKCRLRASALGVPDGTYDVTIPIDGVWRKLTAAEQDRLTRIADGWLAVREGSAAR